MADVAGRRATYDDLLALPEPLVGELIAGELSTHPRPTARHARATTKLLGQLEPPFGLGRGGPSGWLMLVEPGLHLGGDVLVPDVAGWHEERMLTEPDGVGIEVAPDWVCEVQFLEKARSRASVTP